MMDANAENATVLYVVTLLYHCGECALARWLGSLVVRALDSRLDGRGFNSRPPRQMLGWVAVFLRANDFSVSPSHLGQLILLPYMVWEMSISQSAVMLCGCELKVGMVHSTCGETCGWQVCDPSLTRAIHERLQMSSS